MATPEATEAPDQSLSSDDRTSTRATKFRFKEKRRRDEEDGPSSKRRREDDEDDRRSHRHYRRRHHSRRHKTTHSGPTDDPALFADSCTRSSQYLDPNAAFRESLFDALADDEGAAYWETVYGQSIHTYSRTREGSAGEVDLMTDDEYAAYVRGKMWEKTHQHLLEEQKQRAEAKKRQKEQQKEWERKTRKMEEERKDFHSRIDNYDETLDTGERREEKKNKRKELWERYVKEWEVLKGRLQNPNDQETSAMNLIPWPVESGRMRHVTKERVEYFLRNSPEAETETRLKSLLKVERVRWHPDKIQQRFGGRVDDETIKAVTAVFQVIDQMWNDFREMWERIKKQNG